MPGIFHFNHYFIVTHIYVKRFSCRLYNGRNVFVTEFIEISSFFARINMSLTDILSAEAIENAIKDCQGELKQS